MRLWFKEDEKTEERETLLKYLDFTDEEIEEIIKISFEKEFAQQAEKDLFTELLQKRSEFS